MNHMSVRRIAVLTMIAVAMIGGAVFAAGRIERNSAIHASQEQEAAQQMLSSLLDQETGARGYFETDRTRFLQPWFQGGTTFPAALATSRRLVGGDQALLAALADQAQIAASWHAMTTNQITRLRRHGPAPTVAQAVAGKRMVDEFRAANTVYAGDLDDRRNSSLALSTWLAAGVVAALSIALVLIGVLVMRRGLARDARRSRLQRELRELLQVSASEDESRKLLISHVERVVPGSGAAVLSRNNSDDRLESSLGDGSAQTPLASIDTDQMRPRSCMAVRLSRSYERRAGEEPLVSCDVCGKVGGEVVCEPLLVGGQVIGAVLVAHEKEIAARGRAGIRESVIQAAPILANQRNLALAERRAASDALTGLPNRRSADETIKRMAAQAGRSITPLGLLLLDLDRFKQINDLHGHDQGDKALATIAQVLASTLRASDFAARYGGEEFLILLPDTDRRNAADVAEKVRRAIERTEMPNVGAITGSLGVAVLPDDAVEPEHLLRKADRALYLAKARGRNRVEVTEPNSAGGFHGGSGERQGGIEHE
jgi:diguanylate cyclase (GGDEF)-like protein